MKTKLIRSLLSCLIKSRMPNGLPMPLWEPAWRLMHTPDPLANAQTQHRSMHATGPCSKYKRVKPGKVPHPDKCRKHPKKPPICMAERRVDLPGTEAHKPVCKKKVKRSMCDKCQTGKSDKPTKCKRDD